MTAQRRNSNTISIPAPIGGWNTRDPLPLMDAAFAPILDNFFCLPSSLMTRKGWTSWATFTGIGETVFDYDGSTAGTEKLFVAVNNAGACSIYDITAGGAVGAAVVSGLNSARFKHAHFATSGGLFTYIVNGADSALLYDGATWHTITGASAPYAITGVTTSNLIDVISHKRRLWFVEKNSLKCWYLPTDSIAGAATAYDFGPIFSRGGSIVKIDTWTLDAGYGIDDYLVVFTSSGEVAVYRGTDPASASTWAITGVFYIGAPTGGGRTCKYGGDLLIVNKDGIAQMSKSLMSSRVNTQLQLTDKIQPQLAQDTSTYASNYGWDILLYPPQNMLIVNVPISATESYQYVMNTISGAWARWTGIPAKSLYFANENLYCGMDGKVGLMWSGNSDNGAAINWDMLPAYQSFGSASALKRFNLARIIYNHTGNLNIGQRMEVDFALNNNPIALNSISTGSGVYGTAKYGSSIYGGVVTIKKDWRSVGGIGYYGSVHMKGNSASASLYLYSIDLRMESGGTI